MRNLFLSMKGRITRKPFIIAIAALAIYVVAGNALISALANSMTGFYFSLIFLVLFFVMLYAIYGKRLHDIGNSAWALTGMIALTVIVAIVVMLTYGGAEYFNEFSQYDRKDDIDPEEIRRLQAAYQERLSESTVLLGYILWGLWIAFTAWLALAKSDTNDNDYGPAPSTE